MVTLSCAKADSFGTLPDYTSPSGPNINIEERDPPETDGFTSLRRLSGPNKVNLTDGQLLRNQIGTLYTLDEAFSVRDDSSILSLFDLVSGALVP